MSEDHFDALEDATSGMSPEGVLAFLSPLAESGDAAAQCLLADAYDDGTLPRDRAKSVAWYRMSAAQGFARAEFYLGSMIALGFGVDQDYKEAALWFRKAADKGDSAAQFRLGELLVEGLIDGMPQIDEGKEWLRKAAGQNHSDAITLLGSLK